MSIAERLEPQQVVYPESDGRRMADNTLQFTWIFIIEGGLDALFKDDPNVFVAGDLLWYPVEGDPSIRCAPDALVAFGRPKGHRGSYLQWKEAGIPPQVVFEVVSPGNRSGEMRQKLQFYARYGVEEYYLFDPDRLRLSGWKRGDLGLETIPEMNGWVSPRLGIRFELGPEGLSIYGPDGKQFKTFVEVTRERDEADRKREIADREREIANRERDEAVRVREIANRERDEVTRERDAIVRERDAAREHTARLMARLRELGIDPE